MKIKSSLILIAFTLMILKCKTVDSAKTELKYHVFANTGLIIYKDKVDNLVYIGKCPESMTSREDCAKPYKGDLVRYLGMTVEQYKFIIKSPFTQEYRSKREGISKKLKEISEQLKPIDRKKGQRQANRAKLIASSQELIADLMEVQASLKTLEETSKIPGVSASSIDSSREIIKLRLEQILSGLDQINKEVSKEKVEIEKLSQQTKEIDKKIYDLNSKLWKLEDIASNYLDSLLTSPKKHLVFIDRWVEDSDQRFNIDHSIILSKFTEEAILIWEKQNNVIVDRSKSLLKPTVSSTTIDHIHAFTQNLKDDTGHCEMIDHCDQQIAIKDLAGEVTIGKIVAILKPYVFIKAEDSKKYYFDRILSNNTLEKKPRFLFKDETNFIRFSSVTKDNKLVYSLEDKKVYISSAKLKEVKTEESNLTSNSFGKIVVDADEVANNPVHSKFLNRLVVVGVYQNRLIFGMFYPSLYHYEREINFRLLGLWSADITNPRAPHKPVILNEYLDKYMLSSVITSASFGLSEHKYLYIKAEAILFNKPQVVKIDLSKLFY